MSWSGMVESFKMGTQIDSLSQILHSMKPMPFMDLVPLLQSTVQSHCPIVPPWASLGPVAAFSSGSVLLWKLLRHFGVRCWSSFICLIEARSKIAMVAANSLEFLLSGRLFQKNDFSQCFNPLCQAISEPKTHIQKEPKLALTHAFSLIHTQNSAVQQTKAGRAPKITLAGWQNMCCFATFSFTMSNTPSQAEKQRLSSLPLFASDAGSGKASFSTSAYADRHHAHPRSEKTSPDLDDTWRSKDGQKKWIARRLDSG